MLAVIPGDVMDLFMDECNKTLSKDSKPLSERITIAMELLGRIGVTQQMVENKYCCKLTALTERQVAQLRRIFLAVQDGIAGIEDHFNGAPHGDGPARVKATIPRATSAKSTDQNTPPPAEAPQEAGAFAAFQGGPVQPGLRTQTRAEVIKEIMAVLREAGFAQPGVALGKRSKELFKKDPQAVSMEELHQLLTEAKAELDHVKGAVK